MAISRRERSAGSDPLTFDEARKLIKEEREARDSRDAITQAAALKAVYTAVRETIKSTYGEMESVVLLPTALYLANHTAEGANRVLDAVAEVLRRDKFTVSINRGQRSLHISWKEGA